jgi:hypothetical protein
MKDNRHFERSFVMSRHLVIVSLDNASHVICQPDPIVVSKDDEIQWTSNAGEITIGFPSTLVGIRSDAPEVREAPAERFSPRFKVDAEPGWYGYSVSVASAGMAYGVDPHVIVTEP